MPEPSAKLWSFALAVYVREGVSETCLRLQDEFRADVPVLLYVLWLAHHGQPLDTASMKRIDRAIGTWRRDVIVPLRQVRRRLKTGPAPAPDEKTEKLRTSVKGAELFAEKIELQTLAGLAFIPPAKPVSSPPFLDNLSLAMSIYSKDKEVPDRLLASLVEAARAAVETG